MLSPKPKGGPSGVEGGANNIKVCARFRPMSQLELAEDARTCAKIHGSMVEVTSGGMTNDSGADGGSMDGTGTTNQFHFPTVYGTDTDQKTIFEDIGLPVLKDLFQGYNGTIFVYGQTGSGKTFTMLGPHGSAESVVSSGEEKQHRNTTNSSSGGGGGSGGASGGVRSEDLGLMPRLIGALFDEIENAPEHMEFGIAASYVEIYKEKIRDLLNKSKENLHLREDPATFSFYVEGASKRYVTSPTEILQIIAEGNVNRAVASTRVNEHSSRSHSVLQLELKSTDYSKGETKTGKLFLVDLAGSEKVAKTRAEGELFEEAKKINLSLTTLGLVIKELSEGQSRHISYRNSMLTKLLQDSLGGNSKTTLIVCCSPSMYNAEESVSTLRFGARAANIKNRPVVNKELSPDQLKALLVKAEAEIEALRAGRGGAAAAAPSMSELEWQAKLERLTERHAAQLAAKEDDMLELHDRVEELTELNQMKTAHITSLTQEIAQWEVEWSIVKKQLHSEQVQSRKLAEGSEYIVGQLQQTNQDISAVKTRVQSCLTSIEDTMSRARIDVEDTTTERDLATARHQQLEMELIALKAELQELHNENGGFLIELQLAERKLTIRNERIENLKAGINEQRHRAAEMEEKNRMEIRRMVEEAQTLRNDADYWRTQYERLRSAASEATAASPPGTRASRTLRGGSHSPESHANTTGKVLDL